MFVIDELTDKQLARITRHKEFIKTYSGLATGEAGRGWNLFTEFMINERPI